MNNRVSLAGHDPRICGRRDEEEGNWLTSFRTPGNMTRNAVNRVPNITNTMTKGTSPVTGVRLL